MPTARRNLSTSYIARLERSVGFIALVGVALSCGCSPSQQSGGDSTGHALHIPPSRRSQTSGTKSEQRKRTRTDSELVLEVPELPPASELPPRLYDEWLPVDIATDDTHVYWTEGDRGRLRRIPKSGGSPTDLATGQKAPWDLVVVAGRVVFSADGELLSVPKSGGPVTRAFGVQQAAITQSIAELYADDAAAFFIEQQHWPFNPAGTPPPVASIRAFHVASGHVSVIVSPLESAFGLVVDHAYVFWMARVTRSADSEIAVYRAPKGGGAATTIATFKGGVGGVAHDDERIYWTDGEGVRALKKSGGTAVRVTRGLGRVGEIGVGAGTVYFSAADFIQGTAVPSALLRGPASGGSAVVHLWGRFGIGSLHVDDDGVWWGVHGDNLGIVRTPLALVHAR